MYGPFASYSGRVKEVYLPEDGPTELGANVSIADAEWAEQEAQRADSQLGLVLWTDGSQDENGGVECAVVWMKERRWAGRKVHMGFFRRGVRDDRARFGSGSGTGQATQARQGPHLHGCSGCDYADDARRPWPRTDLHPSGEAGDSSPAQTGTCRRDRDPLVPGAQRSPRKRGRGRVGQIGRHGPDDHGVEWLALADGTQLPARLTSLAHLGRRASEKKWPAARSWYEQRHLNKGYVLLNAIMNKQKKVRILAPAGICMYGEDCS